MSLGLEVFIDFYSPKLHLFQREIAHLYSLKSLEDLAESLVIDDYQSMTREELIGAIDTVDQFKQLISPVKVNDIYIRLRGKGKIKLVDIGGGYFGPIIVNGKDSFKYLNGKVVSPVVVCVSDSISIELIVTGRTDSFDGNRDVAMIWWITKIPDGFKDPDVLCRIKLIRDSDDFSQLLNEFNRRAVLIQDKTNLLKPLASIVVEYLYPIEDIKDRFSHDF